MREGSESQNRAEPRIFYHYLASLFGRYWGSIVVFSLIILLVTTAYVLQPTENSIRGEHPDFRAEDDCEHWQYQYSLEWDHGPQVNGSMKCLRTDESSQAKAPRLSTSPQNQSLPPQLADLLAQERMAHWTIWIAIFTSVGLVTVFLTLFETNRTAKFAFRTYEATKNQLLPQIHFETSTISISQITQDTARFDIEINLANAGETTAKNFSYQVDVIPVPQIETAMGGGAICAFGENSQFDIPAGGTYPVRQSFEQPFWDMFVEGKREKPRNVHIQLRLEWSDFDGRKRAFFKSKANTKGIVNNHCMAEFEPFKKS